MVEPLLNGYTETNTQNLNPNINASTGCAASVNNDTYGANLDVSNIPYRKCGGTFYLATGKFGINVVVSDGVGTPVPPPLKGDFNSDSKVNNLDFTAFKNAFKSFFNSIFDLNSDNAIDVKDLGVLMSGWKL